MALAHVAVSVVAVGTNLAFPLATRLAERGALPLGPTLRAVRRIDKWVTIPAYLLATLTGVLLVPLEGIDPLAFWIVGSLALFGVLMWLGFALYRPISRRRVAAAAKGPRDAAYQRAARQATALDIAILGAAAGILTLMVWRPS